METLRCFTYRDLLPLKRIAGEPVPSPSGSVVAVPVKTYHEDSNDATVNLYILWRKDGLLKPLTCQRGSVSSPFWISDSELAYVTTDDVFDDTHFSKEWETWSHTESKEEAAADISGGTQRIRIVRFASDSRLEAYDVYCAPPNLSDVSDLCFHAAASSIVFTAMVDLNVADENTEENQLATGVLHSDLFVRHWDTYVVPGVYKHIFSVPLQRRCAADVTTKYDVCGPVVDVMHGQSKHAFTFFGGQEEMCVLPSESGIIYTSHEDGGSSEAWNLRFHLYKASLSSDEDCSTTCLTSERPALNTCPRISPDGQFAAFFSTERLGCESDYQHLWVYDFQRGACSALTSQSMLDRSISTFVWSKDGQRIFAIVNDFGRAKVFAFHLEYSTALESEARVRVSGYNEVTNLHTISSIACVTSGAHPTSNAAVDTLLCLRNTASQPNELIELVVETSPVSASATVPPTTACEDEVSRRILTVYDAAAAKWASEKRRWHSTVCDVRQLTHLNTTAMAEFAVPTLSDFSFVSVDGVRVHGFVILPPTNGTTGSAVSGDDTSSSFAAKSLPALFLIHGGPQGAFGDDWHERWNLMTFASCGYAVIVVNFHGSSGYGKAFMDSIQGDWGGKPFDDIILGLQSALRQFPCIDGDRVAALGASYGGYMVNWINGHNPGRKYFRCLVCHDGIFDTHSFYYNTEELWFPEWDFGCGKPPYEFTERPSAQSGAVGDLSQSPFAEGRGDREHPFLRHSPSAFVQHWETPTLFIHGERDFRCTLSEGLAAFTACRRRGIPAKLLRFPDENHWVRKPHNARLWYRTVFEWVDAFLKTTD